MHQLEENLKEYASKFMIEREKYVLVKKESKYIYKLLNFVIPRAVLSMHAVFDSKARCIILLYHRFNFAHVRIEIKSN